MNIRISRAAAVLALSALIRAGNAGAQEHSARSVQTGARYRDEIFTTYQKQTNIKYGQASGLNLFLDVYTGTGDTIKNRPLAIFIHAGGFQNGDKGTPYAVIVCGGLARRG